ncbi:MAG: PAS domain S-box protein [Bacteroidota bacterium]
MKLNKLLERQIKKYLPGEHPGINAFLEAVNDSYHAYEKDALLSERAFKMSEEEYMEVNERLQQEVEFRKISIQKLKEAIGQVGEGFNMESDNLLEIVALLKAQIDKRSEAEVQLKAGEELLQFALEGAGDGVWDYDFQTRKIFFSPRYKQMLGYEDDEFANNPDEWMNRIHPEDLHLVMKTDQRYFYEKLASHQVEYRIRHKDDHYIWVLDRGMVVSRTPEGLPGRIIGTHTDITERKLAEQAISIREEKYRNILANMNLGLLEVDNNEAIQYANQSFCEMSGYTLDEMMGLEAKTLFPTSNATPVLEQKNQLRKKGISDAYELTVKNKKGELRWWLISGAPRYNDSGELMGSIGIHLDITERKKLELELNEAREVAEQSVRAKEAFLANMSHEIRTPMNAIIGMGRQLEKTDLQQQQRFFLNTINTASNHLLVVINDILDISKIEAGKLELEKVGFDTQGLIDHVVHVMQPRAEEKGLELHMDIDENIAPVLIGDPHRINQVLLNMISNAVKFTEKGGVTLSCRLQKRIKNKQVLEFSIRDTGIGISEEYIDHVFEKFTQEDRTTARKYGGTGLGMAITKELVELMQGQINVYSKKDIGTEIIISLPFNTGTERDLPEVKKDFTDSSSLKGKRILLAEDNEVNRLVAITVLENYGVIITEAKNGAEAVKALKNDIYDLVLMDVQMPVMNGMEATEVIRRELKMDIPIIALTANAIKGDSDKCIAVGMNAFVSKPFEENDLINAIASCLQLEAGQPEKKVKKQLPPEEESDQPLFSMAKLEQISRGDKAFIQKMVDLFLEQTPQVTAEMHEGLRLKDMQAIKRVAHKVKPMIDSLEIVQLKEVIRGLEAMPDDQPDTGLIAEYIERFESVMDKVQAGMKQL